MNLNIRVFFRSKIYLNVLYLGRTVIRESLPASAAPGRGRGAGEGPQVEKHIKFMKVLAGCEPLRFPINPFDYQPVDWPRSARSIEQYLKSSPLKRKTLNTVFSRLPKVAQKGAAKDSAIGPVPWGKFGFLS